MERRFHSPYKHWVTGFFAELGVLVAFVVVLIVIALATAWLIG